MTLILLSAGAQAIAAGAVNAAKTDLDRDADHFAAELQKEFDDEDFVADATTVQREHREKRIRQQALDEGAMVVCLTHSEFESVKALLGLP